MQWIIKCWASFRTWMNANQDAHAHAQTRARCSSPRERAGRAKIAWIVFVMIAASDLLSGWLALPTMAMFPVMVAVYARLAKREEQDALAEFGAAYRDYRARTPAFLPRVHAADNKRQTP